MKIFNALLVYGLIVTAVLIFKYKNNDVPTNDVKLTVYSVKQTKNYPSLNLPKIQLTKNEINKFVSKKYDLPANLLASQHFKETSNRCNVKSKANAKGCFQFNDITIKHLKNKHGYTFNPYDYAESAEASAIYLNELKNRFKVYGFNQKVLWSVTLAAYNGGPSQAHKWAKKLHKQATFKDLVYVIDWQETRNYVYSIGHKIVIETQT